MAEFLAPEQDLLLLASLAGIALGAPLLVAAYRHLLPVLNDEMRLPGVVFAAGRDSLSDYFLEGVVAGFVFGDNAKDCSSGSGVLSF